MLAAKQRWGTKENLDNPGISTEALRDKRDKEADVGK